MGWDNPQHNVLGDLMAVLYRGWPMPDDVYVFNRWQNALDMGNWLAQNGNRARIRRIDWTYGSVTYQWEVSHAKDQGGR